MKAFLSLIVAAVFCVIPSISPAAVPSTVNYQGRLTDAAGAPLAGSRAMSVRVYDSLTAGALLYSETLGNVPVDANGIYGFQFGANGNGASPAIAGTLGGATEHWLELTVDGVAQHPRQKLQAVPFALVAKGLENGAVTSAMIADGGIPLSKIAGIGSAATANATDFVAATNAALAGIPTAPTAAPGTNSSQLATTAFVLANSGTLPSGGSLTNVVYAKTYGVTADGTTDDTLALQAAIDAAAASATPSARGSVILPRGVIRTRRTTAPNTAPPGAEWKHSILLKNNVNIIGQGIDVTTIKLLDNTAGGTPALLALGEAENITLEGFTVSANSRLRHGLLPPGEGECINIKSGYNILMHQVKVMDAEQDGFDLDGGDHLYVINCIAEDCSSSGIHLIAEGGNKVIVANSVFKRNGFIRRTLEGGGLSGNGAGIDCMANDMIITGCLFENNAVAVHVFAGDVTMEGCVVVHYPTSLNLAAVVAGWTGLPPIGTGTFNISNSAIRSASNTNAIQVTQNWPNTHIRGCTINGKILCSSGKNVTIGQNIVNAGGNPNNAIDIVSASGKLIVSGNKISDYVNGVKVDTAVAGVVSGNIFLGGGGTSSVNFTNSTGNTDNWVVNDNVFPSAQAPAVKLGFGSSGGTFANNIGDAGGFSLQLGGGQISNNKFLNNQISNVSIELSSSSGNLFERNEITGIISHSGGANFSINTWRRNVGAGCAGVFHGTSVLTNGTATVTSPAANSARKFLFSRQAPNSSTGIGHLTLGTIAPQTSFVINSLNDSAATATGDVSSVYWEILE